MSRPLQWTKRDGQRIARRKSRWQARSCPVQVSKDQLWNFRWAHTGPHGGPPIDIHSKRQFLRECKKRRLRWVGSDDIRHHGEPMTPTQNRHDVRQLIARHGREIVERAKQRARKDGIAWA